MTATEATPVTPAEGQEAASTSKESSPSKKEASPVKTKTPEQIKAEADTLIAVGKRDLLLNNVPEAVSNLAQACELLSKQFGETAKECAEVYFYYGKGLLELSRMESGVLGNALDGVPEEESENNTSQFEDPSKLSDQEKNEVTDNVSEALEENFKDLEEKKKASEEKKDEKMDEGKDNESPKDGEEKKDVEAEAPKDDSKKAEGEDSTKDKDEKKVESTQAKEGDEGKKESEATEEKTEDEAMEEDGTEDEEADGEESADEKMEETTEDAEKKDEEEPSNLQLAWEMLELAKVVYTKQLETAEETDKSPLLEKLCSTMLTLGEVSIENENYKQAVEDIQECLKKEEPMPKDARIIAETHYQLGVAQGFNAQHDEAVESLKSAITIIQERIKNMEKLEIKIKNMTDEAKKEVTELKALVPEIEEKINDTKDMKKEAEAKKEGAASSGDAFGSSKAADVKPVSNIAVKRKAEDEESSNKKIAAEKETAAAS